MAKRKDRRRNYGQGRIYKRSYAYTRDDGTTVRATDDEWTIDYRDASGRRVRQRVGRDRAEAERRLAKALAHKTLADAQTHGIAANRVGLADLATQYITSIGATLRPRTIRGYRECLDAILNDIPARTVADLSVDSISIYAKSLLKPPLRKAEDTEEPKGLSARTVDMRITALKRALAWAVRAGILATSPLAAMRSIRGPAVKRRRAFGNDEVALLLNNAPEKYARLWKFILHTGLRHAEFVDLRWKDIDLKRRRLHVRAEISKNGHADWLPLDEDALAVLRGIPLREPESHVFLTGAGTPWRNNLLRAFQLCLRKAGLPEDGTLDIHSLRKTFATNLLRNGVDPRAAQQLTRHRSLSVLLDAYRDLADSDKLASMAKLDYSNGHNLVTTQVSAEKAGA